MLYHINHFSQPQHITPTPGAAGGGSSNTPLQPQALLMQFAPCLVSSEYRNLLINKSTNIKNLVDFDNSYQIERFASIDIGIDYLMGMIHTTDFYGFVAYIESVFKFEFTIKEEIKHHGCYKFERQFLDPLSGVKIFHKYSDDVDIHTAAVIIPGQPCRSLTKDEILNFVVTASQQYRLDFTCIDVCIDDYFKRVNFKKLYQLAQAGDVAGTTVYKYIAGGVVGDWGVDEADTIYFGSKRCNLKVYNADFLHNIDAFRWEGRFREDRAKTLVNYIVENYYNYSDDLNKNLVAIYRYLGNKVLNISKFIKRYGDKKQSISRFKRYRFYQSLLNAVGELPLEILKEPPKPHIDESEFIVNRFNWFNRQVFKSIMMMRDVFGDLWEPIFEQCLQSTKPRFNNSDIIVKNKLSRFMTQIRSSLTSDDFVASLIPF